MMIMKNNTYYWIHTDGIVHKYIPIFRNTNGEWVHKSLTDTQFISDHALSTLYGKGCILREVDFDNDVSPWDDDLESISKLEFFKIDSDNGSPMVMFGTQHLVYYHTANSWIVNRFGVGEKLVYRVD